MIIPPRGARLEVIRWTREADVRAHVAARVPGIAPHHVGEWHTDERVSSIVATDLDGTPLWSALMAEGERDPWLVPAFGGLLLVSRENLLLVDDHARVVLEEGFHLNFRDVLIGEGVVWVVGWYDALRVRATDYDYFEPERGTWDEWRLEGDLLLARMRGDMWEKVG